ncbi:hypothetical protein [Nitrolancea hollandica]|uniref:Uncharacterized protein n=1 Tax=Nitrolancea hollandica Lb TaxID=1129897 RepID=I4EFM7_9BACT|nr:hypothetical protein [Nitrolancea hollandica]CCF83489.1 conserved hypothetical protein [Nitrolancea hollandica Lb]
MAFSETEILNALTQHGFRPAYRSSAVTMLVHPGQPGLAVRVGTTQAVIERDGREIYRAPHGDFDVERLLALVASEGSPQP